MERLDIATISNNFVLHCMFQMFMCMLAATVHCRHLMVWKIFAPKLIFEGLGLFVVLPCVLVSYLLVIQITTHIKALLLRLDKESR